MPTSAHARTGRGRATSAAHVSAWRPWPAPPRSPARSWGRWAHRGRRRRAPTTRAWSCGSASRLHRLRLPQPRPYPMAHPHRALEDDRPPRGRHTRPAARRRARRVGAAGEDGEGLGGWGRGQEPWFPQHAWERWFRQEKNVRATSARLDDGLSHDPHTNTPPRLPVFQAEDPAVVQGDQDRPPGTRRPRGQATHPSDGNAAGAELQSLNMAIT